MYTRWLFCEIGADDRRAHSAIGVVLRGGGQNTLVGDQDRAAQPRAATRQRRLALRPEIRGPEGLADGVYAELAGDLARRVPTHAIGDHEKVVIFQDGVGVFVVLALEARIGAPNGRHQDERIRSSRLLLFLDVDRNFGRALRADLVPDLLMRWQPARAR